MSLNIEHFAGMKTMLAEMAAEMEASQRATGGSITEVAVTLAGNADAGAVNIWCAWV